MPRDIAWRGSIVALVAPMTPPTARDCVVAAAHLRWSRSSLSCKSKNHQLCTSVQLIATLRFNSIISVSNLTYKNGMRILLIKKRALAEPNAIEVTF